MVQNVGHGGAGAGAPAAPEPLLHSFWHGVVGTLFPWELEQQKTTASGTITGVGVIFRQDSSGSLLVHKIVPVLQAACLPAHSLTHSMIALLFSSRACLQGGAASRTGMFLVNDELLEVDGKDVQKQPLSEVSALVLGQAGTQVSLTLYRRATGNRVEVSVVRAENPTQHGNFSVVQDDLLRSPNQAVYVAVPSAGQLTALHTVVLLASRSGEEALEEVAGLLVSGRHDVNARDSDGCTPIFYAAGAARTMQLLLNKRAEVNITNRLGNSPLHYAAAANSLVCVEMLVRYGADRTLRNNIGLTPFQLASSLRKDQAAKYLRALDVREERTKAFLPLSEKKMPLNLQLLFAISEEGAVTDGVPVSTLLQAGADPNVKEDETGMYALHLAIFQQSPATVRALLVAGAEPGFIQDGGDYMPPIACALIDRQVTMTDTLDQRMFPALVLRELLEGDCDVNSEIFIMDNVLSPLHMAIINNDLAAAQLLIENGADLDYMDKHGQTPEELASGGFLVPQPPAPTIESLFARCVLFCLPCTAVLPVLFCLHEQRRKVSCGCCGC
jgi:ankyrin repeat protein